MKKRGIGGPVPGLLGGWSRRTSCRHDRPLPHAREDSAMRCEESETD